jgi:hypothetical protein
MLIQKKDTIVRIYNEIKKFSTFFSKLIKKKYYVII